MLAAACVRRWPTCARPSATRDADPSLHLLITRETIQFNRDSDHSLDVATLLECSALTVLTPPDLERSRQAIALYRGDFLEGFLHPRQRRL